MMIHEGVNRSAADPESEFDHKVSRYDRTMYTIENWVSANSRAKFYLLSMFSLVMVLVFSTFWFIASMDDAKSTKSTTGVLIAGSCGDGSTCTCSAQASVSTRRLTFLDFVKGRRLKAPSDGTTKSSGDSFLRSIYYTTQIIAAGGLDDSIDPDVDLFHAFVFLATMIVGLAVFSILVGLVTETFNSMMVGINQGRSKVSEEGHTLILGWNEATVRVVCQIALLRRSFLMQNETWERYLKPWRRVIPSTPVAAATVVVLCNTKTKKEMDAALEEALLDRGISPKRTKIGWHVVCRVGNPTDPHDLIRAGAHRATSILLMMTDADEEEEELTDGIVQGGATLSAILALRQVRVQTTDGMASWKNFRCIIELSHTVDWISSATFRSPVGHDICHIVDLRAFVNMLMFNCIAQPGLSAVFLDLLGFEEYAFRSKDATAMGLVGMTVGECRYIFEDGIICGVVDTTVGCKIDQPIYDQGLACDPNRVFMPTDRVIMVAINSSPQKRKEVLDMSREKIKPLPKAADREPYDVLVCGWRDEWQEGKRLAARAIGLCRDLPLGSTLCFLNRLSKEDFVKKMADLQSAGMKDMGDDTHAHGGQNPHSWSLLGVKLVHWSGDACDLDTLRDVLQTFQFEAAIVMGTVAGPKLLPASRDRRVLMTMLMLRKLQKEIYGDRIANKEFHVCGENALDATANLAIAPQSGAVAPDMVNTQGITARVLTQALAYPVMQQGISQLFFYSEESPQMVLIGLGKELLPLGEYSFYQVSDALITFPGRASDQLLGYYTYQGEIILSPGPNSIRNFVEGDYLIVLTRHKSHQKDDMAQADQLAQVEREDLKSSPHHMAANGPGHANGAGKAQANGANGGFSWFGEPGNGNDDPTEKIRLALSGVDGDLSPAKSERTARSGRTDSPQQWPRETPRTPQGNGNGPIAQGSRKERSPNGRAARRREFGNEIIL
jgi:hypothetical protein